MALPEQVSVRLPVHLRQFIQEELQEVRRDPRTANVKEADIVRAHLEAARIRKEKTKNGKQQ